MNSLRTTVSFIMLFMFLVLSGCSKSSGSGNMLTPEETAKDLSPRLQTGSSYERYTRYAYDAGGNLSTNIEEYTVSILDAKGNAVQVIAYNGPGQDGSWYTNDDSIQGYELGEFDTYGIPLGHASYAGMGHDGKWFTEDDICNGYEAAKEKNGNTLYVQSFIEPGPDKEWMTDDDIKGSYRSILYNEPENRIDQYYCSFGADLIPHTADDDILYGIEQFYDDQERKTRVVYSGGTGTDDNWFSSDDNGLSYRDYVYDSSGKIVKEVEYICYNTSFITSGPGYFYTWALSPGPDHEWLTDDDVFYFYSTYEYSLSGDLIGKVNYFPGNDGVWDTIDDYSVMGEICSYDSEGRLAETKIHADSGDDGIWGNEDDGISARIEYLGQLAVPGITVIPDNSPPSLIQSEPLDGASAVDVHVSYMELSFSEDIIFSRSMLAFADDDGDVESFAFSDGRSVSVYISHRPLKPHMDYTLTIQGLMDKQGNIMPTETITFQTGDPDTAPPFIEHSFPGNGDTGVEVPQGFIGFAFSEEIGWDRTMLAITPQIQGMTDNRISLYGSFIEININGLTLDSNQEYTFTFTGVKDLSGNVMPPTAISFTTGVFSAESSNPEPSMIPFTIDAVSSESGFGSSAPSQSSWVDIWAH